MLTALFYIELAIYEKNFSCLRNRFTCSFLGIFAIFQKNWFKVYRHGSGYA